MSQQNAKVITMYNFLLLGVLAEYKSDSNVDFPVIGCFHNTRVIAMSTFLSLDVFTQFKSESNVDFSFMLLDILAAVADLRKKALPAARGGGPIF